MEINEEAKERKEMLDKIKKFMKQYNIIKIEKDEKGKTIFVHSTSLMEW